MTTIILIIAVVAVLGYAVFKIAQMYKDKTPKGTIRQGGGSGNGKTINKDQ